MAKGNLLTCRVCGKQYKGCKSCEANQGVFLWRNFACIDKVTILVHGKYKLNRILW